MRCREQERLAQLVIYEDDDDAHWETTGASDSPPIHWAESITCIEVDEERSSIGHQEGPFRLVGGLDISPVLNSSPNKLKDFTVVCNDKAKSETRETAIACLVIMQTVSFNVVYKDTACIELEEPYVPFFLGFREVPAYFDLLKKAKGAGYTPDIILVDGSGVLHPRRCGSASHLGVVADIPTIGVTKSLIQWDNETSRSCVNERIKEELRNRSNHRSHSIIMTLPVNHQPPLGAVVCPFGTRRPIFISPGHRISLKAAVQVALSCCKHRVPEPIRLADIESRRIAREMTKK